MTSAENGISNNNFSAEYNNWTPPSAKSHMMNADYAGRQPLHPSAGCSLRFACSARSSSAAPTTRPTDPATIENFSARSYASPRAIPQPVRRPSAIGSVSSATALAAAAAPAAPASVGSSLRGYGSFLPRTFSNTSFSWLPLLKCKILLTLVLTLTPPLTLTLN